MSVITYAVKASAALLLPALLITDYVDQIATSNITHVFKDVEILESDVVLELRSDGLEDVVKGGAVVQHLIDKFGLLQGNQNKVYYDSSTTPKANTELIHPCRAKIGLYAVVGMELLISLRLTTPISTAQWRSWIITLPFDHMSTGIR